MQDYAKLARYAVIPPLVLIGAYLWPHSRDYWNYEALQWNLADLSDVAAYSDRFDYLYSYIAYCTGSVDTAYLVCVAFSLASQLYFFGRVSRIYWATVALYLARYYVVHDVTQIRASLAIGLLSLFYLSFTQRRYMQSLALVALVVLAHASALIYVPIVAAAVAVSRNEKSLRAGATMAPLLVLTAWLGGSQTELTVSRTLSDIPLIARRMSEYLADSEEIAPHVGLYMYLKIALLAYLLIELIAYRRARTLSRDELATSLIAAAAIGLFFATKDISYAVAARLSELAAPFEAVFLSNALWSLTNRVFALRELRLMRALGFAALVLTLSVFLFLPQLELLELR